MYKIRNPNRKRLCSSFISIDSFEMFKIKQGVELFMNSNKVNMYIPKFGLKTKLFSDRINVEFESKDNIIEYDITLEKQACNYGGFKYYFHCPKCQSRMRILYCILGAFVCRKCANLGYFTQRLNEFYRSQEAARKVEKKLIDRAGSLKVKPPWIKKRTFKFLRGKYFDKLLGENYDGFSKEIFEQYGELF